MKYDICTGASARAIIETWNLLFRGTFLVEDKDTPALIPYTCSAPPLLSCQKMSAIQPKIIIL